MYKLSIKPLQGYDSAVSTTVLLEETTVEAVANQISQSGVSFDGIQITNSEINGTVLGNLVPSSAVFTTLNVIQDVYFAGNNPGQFVSWNSGTGQFIISGRLITDGCAQLGNIEICSNDIKAVNTNGYINLIPNGNGEVDIRGPVLNISNVGNFYSNMTNGSISLIARNPVLLESGNDKVRLVSKTDIELTTKNGDVNITTDTGAISNIQSLQLVSGNNRITTTANHNLKAGDTVQLTGTNSVPNFNGIYTVTSVLTDRVFTVNSSTAFSVNGTSGVVTKTANNSINLNTNFLVKIPTDTKLTFGTTQNNIYGNTGGVYISSTNDVSFVVSSTANINVPQQTKLVFGTSGNNFIQSQGQVLNLNSPTTTLTGTLLQINNTNVRFSDPILTIADYNLTTSDSKDRGIDFRYYDSTIASMSLGWFGYKTDLDAFTFIKNATNSNETITGELANIVAKGIESTTFTLVTGGNIDANCGLIQNVNTIRGCGTTLNVQGPETINLLATDRINIANNIPLLFGTSRIFENTNQNLVISGKKNIQFTTDTNGSIVIPVNTKLTFDNTTRGSQSISSNTSGELNIIGSSNIFVTTTSGNIILPISTPIQFGNVGQQIRGNGSTLTIVSNAGGTVDVVGDTEVKIAASNGNITVTNTNGDIILSPTSGNVRIPTSRRLVFSMSGTNNSISSDTIGNLLIDGNSSSGNIKIETVNSIDLLATLDVNIPQSVNLKFGIEEIGKIYAEQNTLYISNTNGTIEVTSANTTLTNTNGLTILNTFSNITSNQFTINGDLVSLDSKNVRIKDPIVTLANNYTDATKDRGIEYQWNTTSGNSKLGWFGYKVSTNKWTFFSEAVNTDEIITGTLGELQIGNLSLSTGGYLDLSCGEIRSARRIFGCNSVLELTSANILLTASEKILIPNNIPLSFGTTSNSISSNTVGNINVNANSVNINTSTNITGQFKTDDRILSIGGINTLTNDDSKDRGIEYRWYTGTQSKTGFFGYKDNIERFVFIKDGTNTNEIFSGAFGDVQFGNGYFTNLDMSSGTGNITGIKVLSGGEISIVSTSGNINISPTSGSSVLLPYNIPISFGTTNASISANSSGELNINSNNILLNSETSIRFSGTSPIYFGDDNNIYLERTNTDILLQNSIGNILLTPQYSGGSVLLPTYTPVSFGDDNNKIYSDGDKLILVGFTGIQFDGNVNFTGVITASRLDFDFDKYILPLGTYDNTRITNIQNYISNTSGQIRITTFSPTYVKTGDMVILSNTDSSPIVDGEYQVTNVLSETVFVILTGVNVTAQGGNGNVKTNLMTYKGKDVGIQINYWTTTGNSSVTAGSENFRTGFFGFIMDTKRWSFYNEATIANDIVTGPFGDIEINKLYTSEISGFTLTGNMSAGSNQISGTNFSIGGGNINNTAIGQNGGAPGRFTVLNNTSKASLVDLSLLSTFKFSLERFSLQSTPPESLIDLSNRSPNVGVVLTFFSVVGVNFTSASGTMPISNVDDGTYKVIVCSGMGQGCSYTLEFPYGTLIAPNPLDPNHIATKVVFKRQSQSIQLVFDSESGAWILLNSGAYVS
jgi:hypothetical protein